MGYYPILILNNIYQSARLQYIHQGLRRLDDITVKKFSVTAADTREVTAAGI